MTFRRLWWVAALTTMACGDAPPPASAEVDLETGLGDADNRLSADADAGVEAGAGSPLATIDAAYDLRIDGLIDQLESAGYEVDEGLYYFGAAADCAADNCYANNPTTPYGGYFFRPAAGEPEIPPPDGYTGPWEYRPLWRLRQDEAVLFVGHTPPPARYFGYRGYLFSRQTALGDRREIFASLGDTTNQLTIGTEPGSDAPFDARTAMLTVGNSIVAEDLHGQLLAAGFPEQSVNTEVIPGPLARFGYADDADVFTSLVRVAIFADEAAGAAYLRPVGYETSPGRVFRIRPLDAVAPAELAIPPRREPGSGTDELAYAAALTRLVTKIRETHGWARSDASIMPVVPVDGLTCILLNSPCVGDNRDSPYFARSAGQLTASADDLVIVAGVNHVATGKATYVNVSAYHLERNFGILSVTDVELEGTAAAYLPDHPLGDDLWAVTFARSCAGLTHCREIPTGADGLPEDGHLYLMVRAYLEAETKTGPDPGELLKPRLIRVGG